MHQNWVKFGYVVLRYASGQKKQRNRHKLSILRSLPAAEYKIVSNGDIFRTNSMDSLDCLPILLSLSGFTFYFFLFFTLVVDAVRWIKLTYVSVKIVLSDSAPDTWVQKLYHRRRLPPTVKVRVRSRGGADIRARRTVSYI